MKKVGYSFIFILCLLYLINPSAGVWELLPDNLPIMGNLDEVAITTLLLHLWRRLNDKTMDS